MSKTFTSESRPITMAILAMGGEGGGVLADWCVDMAEHSGFWAQTTSVPGVAQRTGTTVYYLEFFPKLAGSNKEPVLSTMAAPGEVDIVIASELMEAGRAVQRGFVSPNITTFITSTHRVYSMTEKMALGDGRVDSDVLLESANKAAKVFIPANFAKVAEDAGSVISAALFGALAGSGGLPFNREDFIAAIERGGVGVQNSTKAFEASYELAKETLKPKPSPTAVSVTIGSKPKNPFNVDPSAISPEQELAIINNPGSAVGSKLQGLALRVKDEFPEPVRVMLVNGIKKCADYQDVAYATLYLDRLANIKIADEKYGTGTAQALNEASRFTALWMCYEDTIRVADLKTRRSRYERVGKEARIKEEQMLQVREFLHPQSEEFADTLPTALGAWLLRTKWLTRSIEKLSKNGIILQTTAVHGYLLLYIVSRLRPIRRRSLRFGIEQARISAWLKKIEELMPKNYELALEVAELATLIKGYGDTHRKGLANFETIMSEVLIVEQKPDAAQVVKALREAALADEDGERLRSLLARQSS